MAGGHAKYRHLSRDSSHRQALLRNLVTSLFKHESIVTTFAKAKEAQRLAEKLVTLGKKDTSASRRRATQIFYEPLKMVPKLWSMVPRYMNRQGGYTRLLRTGPRWEDSGEGAVLSLVDGPKDVRFFTTAQTVARDRVHSWPHSAITELNLKKLTNPEVVGREDAEARFEETVQWYINMEVRGAKAPEMKEDGVRMGSAEYRDEEYHYQKNAMSERKFNGREPEGKGWGTGRRRNPMFSRTIGSGHDSQRAGR